MSCLFGFLEKDQEEGKIDALKVFGYIAELENGRHAIVENPQGFPDPFTLLKVPHSYSGLEHQVSKLS